MSQKGSQNRVGKNVAKSHLETPLTQGGPQMDPRSSKVVQQTPKLPQNDSKMTSACFIFGLKIRAKGHVIFVCCVKKWREFCLGREDLSAGNDLTLQNG